MQLTQVQTEHSKQHFKVSQNDKQPPHHLEEPQCSRTWWSTPRGGFAPGAELAWSRFTLPSALLTFTPLTCVGFCQICSNTHMAHTHTHTLSTLSAVHAASLLYLSPLPPLSLALLAALRLANFVQLKFSFSFSLGWQRGLGLWVFVIIST